MVSKAGWVALTDSELVVEILVRGRLLNEMVGSLYPGILQQEIGELQMVLTERRLSGLV